MGFLMELPPRLHGYWMLLLICIIGLLGIVFVLLLTYAWRRFNRENQKKREMTNQNSSPIMPDLWEMSAQRLLANWPGNNKTSPGRSDRNLLDKDLENNHESEPDDDSPQQTPR